MKAIKIIFISMIMCMYYAIVIAQNNDELPQIDFKHEKFSDIKLKLEEYIQKKEKEDIENISTSSSEAEESPNKNLRHWISDMENHLDANGYLFNYKAKNWQEYLSTMYHKNSYGFSTLASSGGTWSSLNVNSVVNGSAIPNRLGHGRVNCIALDPNNSSIIYAGAIEGGLWKSSDNGITWNCISNNIPVEAIAGIAVNPSNSNNIFILTGRDGNNFQISQGINIPSPSIGVLVTYDGGANWYLAGNSNQFLGENGFSIKITPIHNNSISAGVGHQISTKPLIDTGGVWRSPDGGNSWTKTLALSEIITDIQYKPGSSTCYAATQTAIYKSTDNGLNWTIVSSYSPYTPVGSDIVKLAVSPANSQYVYALFQGASACSVWRSSNSGGSFNLISGVTTLMSYQSGYSYAFAVSPANINTLYMGDLEYYKSTDGGQSWGNPIASFTSNNSATNVHEDAHDIICRNSNEVFVANDGGMYKSNDGGVTFNWLSDKLNCAAYIGFGGYPANPNLFYGGTWDNGNFRYDSGTLNHIGCCDAGDVMVNTNNSQILYAANSNSAAALSRSTDGGNIYTIITASQNPGCGCLDQTLLGFSNKIIQQNPLNPNTIYSMYRDFYVSYTLGTNWIHKSTGTSDSSGWMQAFAQGTNDTTRFYAVKNQKILGSSTNGNSWDSIGHVTGSQPIVEVTVDPTNKNNFFVVCSGYDSTNKVFKGTWTGSGFATITNISAGLPNVPIFKVVYQNTSSPGIYVGTEIGVFFRSNATGNWELFSNGLPFCHVVDLEINYASNVITAATYGRGLWQSTLYSGCPTDFDDTYYKILGIPIPLYPALGSEYYEASNSIHANIPINGGIGTNITLNAGNYVSLTDTFEVKEGSEFLAKIQGCTNPAPMPQQLKGIYAGNISEYHGTTTSLISQTAIDKLTLKIVPNPFTTSTEITYMLHKDCPVDLSIYNSQMQIIQTIYDNELQEAGQHQFHFEADDLPSGIYFVKLSDGESNAFSKMVLSK